MTFASEKRRGIIVSEQKAEDTKMTQKQKNDILVVVAVLAVGFAALKAFVFPVLGRAAAFAKNCDVAARDQAAKAYKADYVEKHGFLPPVDTIKPSCR